MGRDERGHPQSGEKCNLSFSYLNIPESVLDLPTQPTGRQAQAGSN
jgi:hypothetical protein